MKIYIKNLKGLKVPVQANEGEDAAYDIVATTGPMIFGDHIERMDGLKLWKRVIFIEYGTNLYIAPEREEIKNISSFNADESGALCGVNWKKIGIDYHTQLFPRSSISKYNLILANSVGIADNGYRNQLFCRFKYCFQPEDMVVVQEDIIRVYGLVRNEHIYQQGDKIVQIKACQNIPITFETVNELPESRRGLGGFGSSGV